MSKYEFLLFDADNTLLDFTRSEHDAVGETFEYFGLPHSEEHIKSYSEINGMYWKMLERGEVEKKNLFHLRFDSFCQKYGFDLDGHDLCREYMKRLATKSFLYEGSYDMCSALYNTGKYKMYVITNGDKRVQEGRFNTSAISKFFVDAFISEEIGFEKPSVGYFDVISQRIQNFDPKRALVIGDSLTSDISGGINAGIDTCWFNPKGKIAPDDMKNKITYTVSKLSEVLEIV